MINLIIHGPTGKFGKTIINSLQNNSNIKYSSAEPNVYAHKVNYIGYIDRFTNYQLFFNNLASISNIVLLDVTSDIGCYFLLKNLIENKIYYPLVIGSTGNLPFDLIKEYSIHTQVAQISNFSDGITNILNILPQINLPNSDIKIFETHHTEKKDAPSGTAKTLADKIKLSHSKIFSAREGDVYGVHEIIYENDNEKITIIHESKNRNIFAIGCIKWIEKIITLEKGLYQN
jgi:4-hydroxy-tetrahydrodipicolinate reductase